MLLCLLLFTLSAGGWSGYYHSTNMNYMSIGGLVSNSDGGNYFKETFHLAYFGDWEVMGTRRPMAEAFRELITVPVDYSYSASLLVQLAIVAVMLYWTSLVLAGWYGVWVGIGFAGLAFNIARPFLSTTMTEPLGYIWGLFALVFFIQSVKLRSLPHALLALAALTVAMMMRMGALLAIPFMVLWVGYAFAQGLGSRLRLIAIAGAVVLAVVAVNVGLQRFYGQAGVDTGDNFASVACGLSIGQGWQDCDALYKAKLDSLPNERSKSAFLFVQTWRNIVAHPVVLFIQSIRNIGSFFVGAGSFMLVGYIPLYPAESGESYLLILPLMVGAFYIIRRTLTIERSFWFAMLASIALSASIIMLADGWRVLHVTHLFIAAFFALGFAAPRFADERQAAPTLGWRAGAGVLVASLFAFLVFPALAHEMALRERREHPPIKPPVFDEEIVTGGVRMSGFAVIADTAPRPRDIPSLHVSEFVRMVHGTKLQHDFGPFLNQVLPRVPFAFVSAGRMDGANYTNTYIAPIEVLRRQDVWAWRFMTRGGMPGQKPWTVLRDVVDAKPLP